MKKIEKVFYVSKATVESFKHGTLLAGETRILDVGYFAINKTVLLDMPITISWEEPEKKITISESEFERIYPFFPNRDRFEQAKEQLFGERND